ncbi:uncharacterized protein LOC116936651 [Daphnia magna]|uniref:DUF4789 domain-containing protein n=2 Tax=Daphnia magna TaxID=35525 RepID=A0A0P6HRN7_9CRUS|nr:uncharacterized protein LOC116936651 [Daphnia magna]KAK4002342.1 hypothetical protein OUZ56_004177 [Daphnia magna]KZS18604.1 Uncharacterized protein APZ42_015161 [Daphnia magna]
MNYRAIISTTIFVFVVHCGYSSAAVIPPEWADVRVNPCAKASWQYLFWKSDGKCYPIFKQGYPCPATMELVFDSSTKEAKCQCPSGRLYWEEDGRCYEPFTPGPCPEGSFLHPGQEVQSRGMQRQDPLRRTLHQVQAWLGQQYEPSKVEPLGFVHCKQRGYCPANWGFWPATELCYPFDSQGPCQSGSLFRWNVVTQQAECGCQSAVIYQSSTKNDTLAGSSWRPFFWPISATCHEHHTNGPCKLGEVFGYNQSAQMTQCSCSKQLPSYHAESGQCFEKYTRGPCSVGMWLTSHPLDLPQYSMPASVRPAQSTRSKGSKTRKYSNTQPVANNRRNSIKQSLSCYCLPGFVYSEEDDQCFREYTQGPCRSGYFFIRSDEDDIKSPGLCWKNPCARQELYLPESQRCYAIHTQGPCLDGQIILADDAHGIGYRGRCGCSTTNLQHYWPADGKCYAHETTGPCDGDLLFSLRSGDGLTPACACPEDYVNYNGTTNCYKPFSQGPCQWNEWLVPAAAASGVGTNDVGSINDNRLDFEPYVCQCKPGYEYQMGSTYCQPPSLELLFSLPKAKNGPSRRFKRE